MEENENFIEAFPDSLIAEMKMPWESGVDEEQPGTEERPAKGVKPALKLDKAIQSQVQEFIDTSEVEEETEQVVPGTKKTGKESEETPLEETKDNSSSSAVNNLYKLFARANHERGVLPQFTEEEFDKLLAEKKDPVEVLVHLNKLAIQSELDNFKSSLPGPLKTLIDNYEDGVPLMELIKSQDLQQRFDSITQKHIEENEELAKALIIRDAMAKGETLEEATDLYAKYQEAGIDDTMAVKALASLKKHEAARVATLKATAQEQARNVETQRAAKLEKLKEFITASNEIIPGVTISDADKQAMTKTLTEPVEFIQDGEQKRPVSALEKIRSKNTMAFDRTMAYLYNLGVFNLDKQGNPAPDWSKIIKKAKSQTVNELEKTLVSAGDDLMKFAGSGRQAGSPDAPDENFFETFAALTQRPGK